MKSEVIVRCDSGVVSLVNKPTDVKVILRDYDIEGGDYEDVKQDEIGDECVEVEI